MNEGDIHITVTMPSAVSLERGAEVLREIAPHAAAVPRGEGRAHRAGAPRGRHRRRGAQPGRDLRHHEARERVAHRAAARSRSSTPCATQLERARASTTTSASPSRTASRSRSPASAARSWSRSTARISTLMHEKLEEVKRILSATRGARDVEIYRAGSAQHVVADIDREATSRFGLPVQRRRGHARERLRRQAGHRDLGGRAQGGRAREAAGRRRRATRSASGGWRSRAGDGARCRSSSLANVHIDAGPHADQPRAGRAVPGAQVQHRGARHGLVRRRGAGARRRRR